MRNLKMFVVAVAAMAALMAFAGAGTASATELICGGSPCAAETTIEAASEGKVVLDAPFGNVECESTLQGHTTNSVGSADGPITTLGWSNCGGDTVTTLATGSLTVESGGIVKSTGVRVTVIHLGVHCIYETSNTTIGTLTGSEITGSNATLDISATIPRTGGSGGAFCGSSAPWTGSYKVTSPNPLNVDEKVDLSLSAPTFHVGEEKVLTGQNTGNVEWTRKGEEFDIDSGAWSVNLSETCSPNTRNPGQSCTRKVKCEAAGTLTWTLKVESTKGVAAQKKLAVVCDA